MVFNGVVTADRLVAPSFGLFSVARVQKRSASNEDWVSGFFVETDACGITAKTFPICAPSEDWNENYTNADGSPFFHVAPFNILETWSCDNSIGSKAVDRRATVVRQLENISEYVVEQELWLGTNGQADTSSTPAERWLTGADIAPGGNTARKPEVALALVEQAFASNNPGVQATIHVTPLIATLLDGHFEQDGDRLYTELGSLVAISRGGEGSEGPGSGGSDTVHWLYATGPVHVDLGSDELITTSMGEIVNPITNQVTYAAERPAAVYFDGCSWYGALADATL